MKTDLVACVLAMTLTACGGPAQSVDWETLGHGVKLSGDIRCEGRGRLEVLGFVAVDAEGLAGVEGDADAGLDADGSACAGVRIGLGPLRWEWVSLIQSTEACRSRAGTLTKVEAAHE